MNLFILMSALGLSHQINGERWLAGRYLVRSLHPARPRCAQLCLLPGPRVWVAATPSGITLAPEGGAHQSIATPLIGIAQDGLGLVRAGLCRMNSLRSWAGVSATCSAKAVRAVRSICGYRRARWKQPPVIMTPDLQRDITDGAYWLREPGANCDVVIAYTGALAPEAIEGGRLHR